MFYLAYRLLIYIVAALSSQTVLIAADDISLRYRISLATTHFTEPRRDDGTVDYLAALNKLASEGVTAENNAAVTVLQTMGSGVLSSTIEREVYELLGINSPNEDETTWIRPVMLPGIKRKRDPEAALERFWEELDEQASSPWDPIENPDLAEWLNLNELSLNQIAEALQQDRFYLPYIQDTETPGSATSLLNIPLYGDHLLRRLIRVYAARGQRELAKQNFAGVFRDLQAMYRICFFFSQGMSLVENHHAGTYLVYPETLLMKCFQTMELATAQLEQLEEMLAGLPPHLPPWHALHHFSRVSILQAITDRKESTVASVIRKLKGTEVKSLDWDVALTTINHHFDEWVAAAQQPTWPDQMAAITTLAEKFDQPVMGLVEFNAKFLGEEDDIQRMEMMGNQLLLLLFPRVDTALESAAEAKTSIKLAQLLIAVKLHQQKQQERVTSLEELQLPDKDLLVDPFSGKPFQLKHDGSWTVIYSVGPNQTDDGGYPFDDGQENDDIIFSYVRKSRHSVQRKNRSAGQTEEVPLGFLPHHRCSHHGARPAGMERLSDLDPTGSRSVKGYHLPRRTDSRSRNARLCRRGEQAR